MDSPKGKCKKGILSKTWERCKSFNGCIGRKGSLGTIQHALKMMSKSWPRGFIVETHDQEKRSEKRSNKVTPKGCFSIYVGPDKERFVIKTKYLNHPLFNMLLEEAESEYGYSIEGPLALPCEVNHFIKVLMKMDCSDHEDIGNQKGCNFVARSLITSSLHQDLLFGWINQHRVWV
ncbi:hypothetical protein Pfo_024433 [Paulownia fortunei]|nr:hypothetical protein Pfo_024433 [Paulownia fortunei]